LPPQSSAIGIDLYSKEICFGHDAVLRMEGLALPATFAIVIGHIPEFPGDHRATESRLVESARALVLMLKPGCQEKSKGASGQ
jgi:hypothetical protein